MRCGGFGHLQKNCKSQLNHLQKMKNKMLSSPTGQQALPAQGKVARRPRTMARRTVAESSQADDASGCAYSPLPPDSPAANTRGKKKATKNVGKKRKMGEKDANTATSPTPKANNIASASAPGSPAAYTRSTKKLVL